MIGRLLSFIPVLFVMLILVFLLLHLLPGDPVDVMLHGQGLAISITMEEREALRNELGLNDPLPLQFASFVANLLRGDLGHSILTRRPVSVMLLEAIPHTIRLVAAAMVFAMLFGFLFGTLAAYRHNSKVDYLLMFVSTFGISVPDFWLGLLLIFVFALRLNWLPATGQGSGVHLILPAITLGLAAMALIARVTRSSTLEELRADYILTARAKGLSEPIVIWRHAFRNALIPIITIVSLQLGRFIAGSIVIETVFARQGIGRVLIDAILAKDFPVVQGTILITAGAVLFINLVTDLLYVAIDPRIRYS